MNPCSRASRGVRITVVRTVVGVRPRSSNAFRTSLAAAISFGQSGTTSSSTSTPVIFGSVPKCRIRSWQRRIARFPASTATVRASARVRPSGELPPPPLLGRSALRGGDYPDVQRHRLGVAVEVGGVALEGERDGGETLLLRLSLGSRSATIDMKRGYPEMPVLGFVIEEELSAQRTHGEIVLQLAELLKGVPVVLGDAGERGPAEIHTVMVGPDSGLGVIWNGIRR